jgi:translation initiation factor IF-1
MDNKEIKARVIETLPNLMYKVQTEDGNEYICYVSGRMKLHKIFVSIGDTVLVILDPYKGKATNRITRRL